jgi:diguanylate cyclase (GGDEF)-like protein/PAS domain S-box-containing protein
MELVDGLDALSDVLRTGSVRSVFQPIIALDTGSVVAYEALARGPEGPLSSPDALFAAARGAGRLAELDEACRRAAFTGGIAQGLLAPLTLFVNVEPEVLDSAPLDDLLSIAEGAPGGLRVVLEITERALVARPAELLRTVERVHSLGWGVALDDVGADSASLAFMPLLRPEVVKLDLRLVQDRPGPVVAEIMNAVNAYSERTGALVLAEGIETDDHLHFARALGATLGQGWLFGRPQAGPNLDYPVGELRLPSMTSTDSNRGPASPFSCLPATVTTRVSSKGLLIELSKQLEREALRLGETCVVAATFQEARHFTVSTMQRYRDLAARTGFVCALGEDLPSEPVPGVRGASMDADDPIRGEWDLTVLSPHFSAALLARDLGDSGPDLDRSFEYALTYDRDTVVRAAYELVSRVLPRRAASQPVSAPATRGPNEVAALPVAPISDESLLHRALAATTSGVSIVDLRIPDQPIVFANAAFSRLSGFPTDQVVGRNCRFLQGPDTDPGAVSRIRAAVDAGLECRETLINYRGPDHEPWWNELYLAPVADENGVIVQYIGVQSDATARVEAERALVLEKDRSKSYLARIEQFAYTDPLTGIPNRRRVEEHVEAAIWDARISGQALALLFLDLNGFKAVNDRFGHSIGDELLVLTAQRLQTALRHGDLLGRFGGDEFLVVLPGLNVATAHDDAQAIASKLIAAVAAPVELHGQSIAITTSVGIGLCPDEAEDFTGLLHLADRKMYSNKRGPVPLS